MAAQFIQVRPVKEDGDEYSRAFTGDKVAVWGVYLTDSDGIPMNIQDYVTRSNAISYAKNLQAAGRRGLPIYVDELDGSTSELPL